MVAAGIPVAGIRTGPDLTIVADGDIPGPVIGNVIELLDRLADPALIGPGQAIWAGVDIATHAYDDELRTVVQDGARQPQAHEVIARDRVPGPPIGAALNGSAIEHADERRAIKGDRGALVGLQGSDVRGIVGGLDPAVAVRAGVGPAAVNGHELAAIVVDLVDPLGRFDLTPQVPIKALEGALRGSANGGDVGRAVGRKCGQAATGAIQQARRICGHPQLGVGAAEDLPTATDGEELRAVPHDAVEVAVGLTW